MVDLSVRMRLPGPTRQCAVPTGGLDAVSRRLAASARSEALLGATGSPKTQRTDDYENDSDAEERGLSHTDRHKRDSHDKQCCAPGVYRPLSHSSDGPRSFGGVMIPTMRIKLVNP